MKPKTTNKDLIIEVEQLTKLSISDIKKLLNIKHIQSFENKVKLFNFVLMRIDSSEYIEFTLKHKHLIYSN